MAQKVNMEGYEAQVAKRVEELVAQGLILGDALRQAQKEAREANTIVTGSGVPDVGPLMNNMRDISCTMQGATPTIAVVKSVVDHWPYPGFKPLGEVVDKESTGRYIEYSAKPGQVTLKGILTDLKTQLELAVPYHQKMARDGSSDRSRATQATKAENAKVGLHNVSLALDIVQKMEAEKAPPQEQKKSK